MPRYDNKCKNIAAVQYTGQNKDEIEEFLKVENLPQYFDEYNGVKTNFLIIDTIVGKHRLYPANYVCIDEDDKCFILDPYTIEVIYMKQY